MCYGLEMYNLCSEHVCYSMVLCGCGGHIMCRFEIFVQFVAKNGIEIIEICFNNEYTLNVLWWSWNVWFSMVSGIGSSGGHWLLNLAVCCPGMYGDGLGMNGDGLEKVALYLFKLLLLFS